MKLKWRGLLRKKSDFCVNGIKTGHPAMEEF
jgi:hypothetical protein